MKLNLSVLLFFILTGLLLPQSGWYRITSPTHHFLENVCVVDSLTLFVSGDSGFIAASRDGGKSWEIQNSGTSHLIEDMFFVSNTTGWATARLDTIINGDTLSGSLFLSTTNGGTNWTKMIYQDINSFLFAICFIDSLFGFVGGEGGYSAYTTDGAQSWKKYEPVNIYKAYDLIVSGGYKYLVCGVFDGGSAILKSPLEGGTWIPYTLDSLADPMQKLIAIDSLNLVAVSGDYEFSGVGLARTTDGGETWIDRYIGIGRFATDIARRTKDECWVPLRGNDEFSYLIVADSGFGFMGGRFPDTSMIFDIEFSDSLHGYAVGSDGVILKYDKRLATDIEFNSELVNSFNIKQNYPNPFNPETVIEIEIPDVMNESDRVFTLSVYDILGRMRKEIFTGELNAGMHKFNFNGAGLPSGVYFYRLSNSKNEITKKMILLK